MFLQGGERFRVLDRHRQSEHEQAFEAVETLQFLADRLQVFHGFTGAAQDPAGRARPAGGRLAARFAAQGQHLRQRMQRRIRLLQQQLENRQAGPGHRQVDAGLDLAPTPVQCPLDHWFGQPENGVVALPRHFELEEAAEA